MEYNIYAGFRDRMTYQETEDFNSKEDALQKGQDIAAADAEAYGWSLEDVEWTAIETALDTISTDDLVGSKYM